jgi:hypothetical protein
MNDLEQRSRDLAEFANATGQPNQPVPHGNALVRPTTGLAERVIGAQPVSIYRDEAKVLAKLSALAAAAGTDWFYRFPVKKKEGGVDYIEGPSIKLANDVARIFGNNINEVREIDVGDAWVFYARFTDIETGFSMERAYRQRKSQGSLKTKDADRQLDIAYQIGQSKAIRNCIVNALQIYADFAFEQARDSLVEKIGKELPRWRERTVQGLAKMPVELARVERAIGRASRDWLAPNVAQVIAMMKSVADGMATVDEVFPPIEAPAPEVEAERTAADMAAADQQGGGAQSSREATVADETRQSQATPENSAATDPIAIAHRLGIDAKAAGHTRRAVPVEYREPERRAECEAWWSGFDGKPLKGLL